MPHACTDPHHHVHSADAFVRAVERACGERPALPPHLADLFQREERCTVLANDLKAVQAFVAAHGNRGKPL